MIYWDATHKQILSKKCFQCPDDYFAPYSNEHPQVGCCSYSPAFGLFEIYQMVKSHARSFFWQEIYGASDVTIEEYQIVVHASVHPDYPQIVKQQTLSDQEAKHLQLRLSICQFFEQGTGCRLPSAFKNSTCRSFICLTVEEEMDDENKRHLSQWASQIRQEVETFVHQHQPILKAQGWTFKNDMEKILDYLELV